MNESESNICSFASMQLINLANQLQLYGFSKIFLKKEKKRQIN